MSNFLRKYSNVGIIIVLLFSAFLICFQSPDNIFFNNYKYTDSGVFTYFARLISEGGIPYIDSFDHKGPLLYFINFIGYSINHSFGTWLIEIIFWFITLYFSYKTVNIFFSKKVSLVTTLLTYILTVNFFDYGNLTEEYSLLFLSISIYIFVKFLRERSIKKFQIIICGVCFGLMMLLRPNNAFPLLSFIFVIIFELIKNKQIKELLKYILLYIIGIFIVIAPVVVFYMMNHGLTYFINSYILFNLNYAGSGEIQKIDSLFYFFNRPMFYLIIILYLFVFINYKNKSFLKNKDIIVSFVISFILAIITVTLSGRTYNHYGLIVLPFLVFPLCILIDCLFKMKTKDTSLYIIMFLVFSYIIFPALYDYKEIIKNEYLRTNEEISHTVDVIQQNTNRDDLISVFGNKNEIYNYSDRFSASYYSFQSEDIFIYPEAKQKYYDELKNAKLVVDTHRVDSSELQKVLKMNNYKLIDNQFYDIYLKQK